MPQSNDDNSRYAPLEQLNKEIIEVIERDEGGFTAINIADDSGGLTFAGITAKTWDKFFENTVFAPLDINGTRQLALRYDAIRLYRTIYMHKANFEQILSNNMRIMTFSMAILLGKTRTIKLLQKTINNYYPGWANEVRRALKVDGILGQKTLDRVNTLDTFDSDDIRAPQLVFGILCQERLIRVAQKHPKNIKFLLGWFRRVEYYKHCGALKL